MKRADLFVKGSPTIDPASKLIEQDHNFTIGRRAVQPLKRNQVTQEQSRYHKKQFSQSAAQWKGVAFAGGQKLALSTAQGARKHARIAGGLDLPSVGGKTADGLGKAAETPAES